MLTNVFKTDPVTLNWWSLDAKEGWSVTRTVLLGEQPSEIKKTLDARLADYNRGAKMRDDKILKSHFGTAWRYKLGFEQHARGGDLLETEFTTDPELVVESKDAADLMSPVEPPEEPDREQAALPPGPESDTPIGDDDALDIAIPEVAPIASTDALELTVEDMVISLDDITAPTKAVVKKAKGLQFIYDIDIFPEDKVSELKYKINARFGVPIFRQHLWYRASGQSFPMQYRFYQGGASVPVDMQNVINASEKAETVCGMPINMFLYRNKETLKVEAYDNFTLLGNIYAKNGVTEYNIVDLATFVEPHRAELVEIGKNDKYQLHILYYGFVMQYYPQLNMSAFMEYIDERTIKSSYPLLEPSPDDLNYLGKQQKLINELYTLYETDPHRVRRIDTTLQKSLTETTLKVSSIYKGKTINLRVLFDFFETSSNEVDALRLYDVYDGRHIIIDKYHAGSKKSTEKLIPGVLYFRVIVSQQPYQRLNLFLYPNGAYAIRGVWGEDQHYEFSDVNLLVDRHVNPIIKRINAMSGKVMYHGSNTKIQMVEKSNVKYIDISISLFWKKILTTDEFRQLKSVLDSFVSAKIIAEKQVEKNTIQYFFKKGIYEFDPKRIEKSATLDNYYAYLFNSDIRQKWFMLFENIRVLTVTHRFSDVKIEISGIKEDEYYIFVRYIVLLMSAFMRAKREIKTEPEERRITKPLNNLKEQDPHLYNFKKIYDSKTGYSTICQKPYQPILLTQGEYDQLDRVKKDATVKYWNFTTNTDAYYQCPNPKYPHIRFITGKHPMGYCIPCCKITPPPENVKDRQRQIYDKCLREHVFEKRDVERSTSRYIMSYGKPIDIGRLSHLPETSLEPLFYETKIEDQGHQATDDEDELIGAKYYLFGVPQNWYAVKKVGVLHCFSNATGMNLDKLVELLIDRLEQNSDNFQLLLNGKITQWFRTPRELVSALRETFLSGPNAVPFSGFDAWNELVMDIAMQFLEIYTIIFEDRDTVIQLRLPDYLDNISDMQYPNHRHLILLHNLQTDYWNPVYIVHKDLYFRAGIVDRKLYNFQSDIVQLIFEMIRTKSRDEIVSHRLTFDIVKRFVEQNKRYTIEKLLVTRDNLCYGLIIDPVGYIPVHVSHFKFQETLTISFSSVDIKPAKIKRLTEFMTRYNTWVLHESERAGFVKVDVPLNRPLSERVEPIYPVLSVERWLVHNDRCVAFISHGLNFYIEPSSVNAVQQHFKRHAFQQITYNPIEINRTLERFNSDPTVRPDDRTRMVNAALYKNYTYQLLILEFIQMFSNQRNVKIRTSLKRLFMKTDFKKNTKSLADSINEIVLQGFEKSNIMLLADIEKIKNQIVEYIMSGEPKKHLLEMIDTEYYNFDMILIERLKKLPRKQIHEQLKKLAMQIVHVGTPPHDFVFPNILQSCRAANPGYCKQSKLIITKTDLDRYLEILADQIKNPFVEKYLFSPLFQNSIIDYFKFQKRADETIEIEFLN